MKISSAVIALASMGLASACIAPSVVESSGRAVAIVSPTLEWRPATKDEIVGLYESVSIEGEAAASLMRCWYSFAADGSYSGAALVVGGANPEFQTLSGAWSLADGTLDLGPEQTTRAFAAEDQLKLESEGGVAILRRSRTP